MSALPHLRGYMRSRDSSSNGQHQPRSVDGYPYPQENSPLASPFEERFPQLSTSFSLPHSRNASVSSSSASRRSSATSESTRSASGTGGTGVSTFGTIPRTTSSSTWGDYSHDVELLLGEEGRGMSPSRNGPRSVTPSRSNSQLSQSSSSWVVKSSNDQFATPSTPRSETTAKRNGDLDTTPKGQAERSTTSPPSSRPLHTPPQMFPSSPSLGRTSFDSPSSISRARMSSQTSYSALRPPSSQSNSSNSSTYSLEDNSWATELAPSHQYDAEVASPRAPLFSTETSQARPLSEFDFAAAYARSDGGGSLPNSPMLPTVGIVQPASPVAPSSPDRFPNSDLPNDVVESTAVSSSPPSHATPPLPPSSNLLTTNEMTTPSSSRAPSPAPSLSLSPNNRPSSRASSNRSVSSPVRPPRRVASNINLNSKPESSPNLSTSSVLPSSCNNESPSLDPPLSSNSSTKTTSTSTSPNITAHTAFVSPRGSPRPPNIPEKSRRRASTLGLGFKRANGHGRNESREIDETGSSRPASVTENGGGGTAGNAISSFSNPDTPLSASDFADVYGKLHDDNDWDTRSTASSLRAPSSASASPVSNRTQQVSQHTRDAASAASSFDTPEPLEPFGMDDTKMHSREETIKARGRGGANDVFSDDTLPEPKSSNNSSTTRQDQTSATTPNGDQLGVTPTEPSLTASRSSTPRGDAKARAAAFIADLKRSKQEAEKSAQKQKNEAGVVDEEDETITVQTEPAVVQEKEQGRQQEEDTIIVEPSSRDVRPPQPKPISRTSEASIRSQAQSQPSSQPRSQPSSRSSTLPYSTARPQQPTLPPLLRRRPLPMAIQASGEIQRARTAGERARIYAAKINELNRENSRLDEWIDAVRGPRLAVSRAFVTSPTASPLRTARSFRQDASTATFAPRGDGYRAKEIVPSTFGPRDLQPINTPYPGVLSHTSSLSNTTSISSQRSLGSGLPAVSAQSGSGKSSFFSRSLGRRTSKREPPSSLSSSSTLPNGGGGGISGLPISNPSPLLYSSSATTTTAPYNLRSIVGPRMPGAGTGGSHQYPTLNSRASFDSRAPTPTNSTTTYSNLPHPHRASISFGSASNTPNLSSAASMIPNSPNSFSSVSTSPSPLLPSVSLHSSSVAATSDRDVDPEALNRLIDVLPQAPRADLVKSLRKAGGGDDILAISIYLSEREAGLK
ncbi:hypothetical protein JCM3765_007743 [Sporobolomyces pararoseus]